MFKNKKGNYKAIVISVCIAIFIIAGILLAKNVMSSNNYGAITYAIIMVVGIIGTILAYYFMD